MATHPTDTVELAPEFAALKSAKLKWQRREPSAYAYSVDRDCVCPEKVRETYVVIVQDGTTRSELKYDANTRPPEPLDIHAIFELLEDALRNADSVSVTYDTEYGFPDNLRIDWRSQAPDDEQAFYIRELRLLR